MSSYIMLPLASGSDISIYVERNTCNTYLLYFYPLFEYDNEVLVASLQEIIVTYLSEEHRVKI
jgi:hypothetical protein